MRLYSLDSSALSRIARRTGHKVSDSSGRETHATELTEGIQRQLDYINKCDGDMLTDSMIGALEDATSLIEGTI